MAIRVACLSPFSEETVRDFFKGRYEVEVASVPEPPAPEEVLRAVAGAELVVGDNRHRHRLDRSVLETMTSCRLIQQPAVGFDAVDHRAAAELGIPVANAAGYNRFSVADWVIMAMLNLIRRGAWADRRMREADWPRVEMTGRELGALTVGIIGLGNVGTAVAERLRGFGTRILFHDIVERRFESAEQVPLNQLLESADLVTVHVPLDHDTRGLIGPDAIGRMRRGSFLINASRGPVVDEGAVTEALRSGHIAAAGLDVYEFEPLAADSPLRSMENVFLSPHAGGATEEAVARMLQVCSENLLRVLDGEEPLYVVNGVRAAARR
jgi:D-3-phosphoglycerate dehydrogenase